MASSLGELSASVWILTDGKAGDEGPARALVEALGLVPDVRRIAPRTLFVASGLFDPAEARDRPGSPISGPPPDIVIASGRRTLPYLSRIKRASGRRTFTVFLKDPRRGIASADLIWVPEHDALRGRNVVVTSTGPHAFSAARLAADRAKPDARLAGLAEPRVAVLVGGNSRHHRFTDADKTRLLSNLTRLAASGVYLMITPSRRTPPDLAAALADLAQRSDGFFWDGRGDNPLPSLLALADAVVATADSTNMVGEAAATGRPIMVFSPSGGHPRISRFLASLDARGITAPFTGQLEAGEYPPLDATPVIAQAIAEGLARHRAGLLIV